MHLYTTPHAALLLVLLTRSGKYIPLVYTTSIYTPYILRSIYYEEVLILRSAGYAVLLVLQPAIQTGRVHTPYCCTRYQVSFNLRGRSSRSTTAVCINPQIPSESNVSTPFSRDKRVCHGVFFVPPELYRI